jgi:hypothetical protein
MSIQFSTFDTKEDRRELVILFEKLGSGLPDEMQNEVRAKWLEMLVLLSMNGMDTCPVQIDPVQCSAVGAYNIFVQFVGVLGIRIDDGAKLLDDCVKKKGWLKPHWLEQNREEVADRVPILCVGDNAVPRGMANVNRGMLEKINGGR